MRRRSMLALAAFAALSLAPAPSAARGRRRVDVDFRDADLSNVLTILAEAAHLSLVVGEGVGGKVTAKLKNVDPVDAMRALSAAHGADLELHGSVAIVSRR